MVKSQKTENKKIRFYKTRHDVLTHFMSYTTTVYGAFIHIIIIRKYKDAIRSTDIFGNKLSRIQGGSKSETKNLTLFSLAIHIKLIGPSEIIFKYS